MSKENLIAYNTLDKKIKSKEEFSLEEIQKEISNNGGIPWVNAGCSISRYIDYLARKGKLFLSPLSGKYKAVNQMYMQSD